MYCALIATDYTDPARDHPRDCTPLPGRSLKPCELRRTSHGCSLLACRTVNLSGFIHSFTYRSPRRAPIMTRPDVGVFVSVEGQRAVTLSSDLEDDEVGRQIWEVRLAPDRALALADELGSQA